MSGSAVTHKMLRASALSEKQRSATWQAVGCLPTYMFLPSSDTTDNLFLRALGISALCRTLIAALRQSNLGCAWSCTCKTCGVATSLTFFCLDKRHFPLAHVCACCPANLSRFVCLYHRYFQDVALTVANLSFLTACKYPHMIDGSSQVSLSEARTWQCHRLCGHRKLNRPSLRG